MRKVVLQEFISIDGLAAGPNDSVDFIPASTRDDQTFGEEQLALMITTGTLLLGRVTYSMFSQYWPNVGDGPEQEFADRFNSLEKIVFSNTFEHAPWGAWDPARVEHGRAADVVARLKRESGKDILVSGSISIAQSLSDAGLVDEYRLVLCPFVLGRGRSLFPNGARPAAMKLARANPLQRGAVSLIYEPASPR
jgi:dihydrofolate reductase